MMMRLLFAATVAGVFLLPPVAGAAAPIEGLWKTESGENAAFYACDGGAMCIKVTTGLHAGKVLSSDLRDAGDGVYAGSLFNPEDERTYSGRATLNGDGTLKLKGCALKIFCKSQTWTRVD